MDLTVYSDLHLEFGSFEPGEGDVCVLAGDILCVDEYYHPDFLDFVEKISQRYNKVFYVPGNHEHYYYDFSKTVEFLRDVLPSNIRLLYNNSEYHDGVHFIGATMWADFKGSNPVVMEQAGSRMNDYLCIYKDGHQLKPADTLAEFDNTITWFNQVLPTLRGKRVVITHHAPSPLSVGKNYNTELSGAYASDLTHLIETYCPDLWIHGHIHESNDYQIGKTRIISNPRGYTPHSLNPDFDPNYCVTV